MLGALLSVLDPGLQAARAAVQKMPGVVQMVSEWIAAYQSAAASNPALQAYVRQSQTSIQRLAVNQKLTSAAPTIFYRVLAHDPFVGYQTNPARDLRLSKLSRLLEAFCAQFGRELYTDKQTPGIINQWWLMDFYYIFCGYLETHGMDDDEDDEVVVPPGMLPIMTIHQAKGLEFDFVFVGSLGRSVSAGDAQQLEQVFRPFWLNPPLYAPSATQAAWQDEIRLHFVAYSRAKYALVLLATDRQLNNSAATTASFSGRGGAWARQNLRRL